jgi:hypothetical protein
VALQQTTQELWASQGPFKPYTIHGITQQNIPEIYIKGTVWNAQSVRARYHARSSAPEELGAGTWFPIDFNEEHVCWVEVCWIELLRSTWRSTQAGMLTFVKGVEHSRAYRE